MNTISWAGPSTPLRMEINPRSAFERLFGDGGSDHERRARLQEDQSILDGILDQARGLHARLGVHDRSNTFHWRGPEKMTAHRICWLLAAATLVAVGGRPLSAERDLMAAVKAGDLAAAHQLMRGRPTARSMTSRARACASMPLGSSARRLGLKVRRQIHFHSGSLATAGRNGTLYDGDVQPCPEHKTP